MAFVAGILMSIYALLGGFDEIKTGKSKNNVYSIAGKRVAGERMHVIEGNLFKEVRDLIKEGKLEGELCLIDYQKDSMVEGEINRFIGVKLNEEISAIPSGYEVIEINSRTSYMAALNMHPLVMPNSKKVKGELIKLALEDGHELRGYTLEIYYPDNSVWIEMFAKSE